MRTSSNLRLWMLPTLFAAVLLMPHAALAANSLGDMVMTAGEAMARPFAITIAMAAYLVGIAICISGLLKIVESAERGMTHDGAAIDGLMKIFFGSLLLVLPDIMGVGLYTLIQSDTGYVGSLSGTGVGAPQDCLGASASGAAGGAGSANIVTCVAQNLATNLVPIGIQVAFAMFYVVGLTMVFSVLVGLSKAHARGGRGLPEGWWVRLGIGFLSCNVPTLMGAIATSLGFHQPGNHVRWSARPHRKHDNTSVTARLFSRRHRERDPRAVSDPDRMVFRHPGDVRGVLRLAWHAVVEGPCRRQQAGLPWLGVDTHRRRCDVGKRQGGDLLHYLDLLWRFGPGFLLIKLT